MRYRIAALMLGFVTLAAACTTADGMPATAPPVPETVAPTTTEPSTTTTTTTTAQTTTTVSRAAEIQAIFDDLEYRRLQAIYDQDEATFVSLYANEDYLELDLEAFESVRVIDPNGMSLSLVEVAADTESCLAAKVQIDARLAFEGGSSYTTFIVLEDLGKGWGYSWVGEEWTCDGRHPLSG